MAVPHGKVTEFWLDNAAGTLIDLSTYLTSVSYPRELGTHEINRFKINSKSRIVGLADGSVTIEGPYDPVLDAQLAAIYSAFRDGTLASVSYEYGPEGGATGDKKYSGELVMKSYDVGSDADDVPTITAEFECHGDQSYGAFA